MLVDWDLAKRIASRTAGPGVPISQGLQDEFLELARFSQAVVCDYTGLKVDSPPTARVVQRDEWAHINIESIQKMTAPIIANYPAIVDSRFSYLAKPVNALELGGILGFVSRKVLGQFDMFYGADDEDDIIVFVEANLSNVENQFAFVPRNFRKWVGIHEATHRVQFRGVPWMRDYFLGLVESFLGTLKPGGIGISETLKERLREKKQGANSPAGPLAFLTPEQREIVERIQSFMALLEGHANAVMNVLGDEYVPGWQRMARVLEDRRQKKGFGRIISKVLGLDMKMAQYKIGEDFVNAVVAESSLDAFSKVWESPNELPTTDELDHPSKWLERIVT